MQYAHYTPANWYWVVDADPSQVFFSGKPGYVAAGDAGYQAWLAAGNLVSRIRNPGELAHVLVLAGLPIIASAVGATSFATLSPTEAVEALTGLGLTVTSTGTPVLSGTYPLDDATQMQVLRRVAAINNNGGNFPAGITSYTQLDIAEAPHSFTSAAGYIVWAEALNLYGEQLASAAMEPTPSWPAGAVTIA